MDTNVIALALKKIGADREAVGPGKYVGTAMVKIRYDLTVGIDYEQKIVGKVPWMALAAVLMSKVNGVTLESVIAEAMTLESSDIDALSARATAAMATLVEPTLTVCHGKVTGDAQVVEVLG